MAAHVRLKNEFTEDEKYHNPMRWLIYVSSIISNALGWAKLVVYKLSGRESWAAEFKSWNI